MPLVSVIVPMRNEEAHVEQCLQSLAQQTYPKASVEILVIDGESEDRSASLVRQSAARHSNVTLLSNPQKTTAVGKNVGLHKARGEYLALVDAHSSLDPDYLAEMVSVMERRPDVACAGGTMTSVGTGYLGKAIALVLSSPFGVGGSKFRTGGREQLVDTVAFGVYRRSVFEKVGLFDERLVRNQDIELSSRMRAAGSNILLSPKVSSQYYAPDSVRKFAAQAFSNGLWNIRTARLVGQVLSVRHFVPLVFVAALAAGLSLLTVSPTPLVMLAVTYALGALAFSVRSALSGGLAYLPILPFLFLVIHLSYGIGSLAGLLEWVFGRGPTADKSEGELR